MPLIGEFYFDSQLIFSGQGRNPGKNFIGMMQDLKTPKGHFEIN